jgi:gliding motility-associated-like protein
VKRLLILAGIAFAVKAALAQPYPSRRGTFQVDQQRFCAGYTITIITTSVGQCTNTPGNLCIMDYENGKPCPSIPNCQNQLTYTYNTPGTYKLSISYQNVLPDDIIITVDPSTPPAFEIYTCSSNQVSIKVTDKNYDLYDIDFGDLSPIVQIASSNNQVAQHAYSIVGKYNISVRGKKFNAANNCNAMVQSFQATPTLSLPQINALTAVDAATLKLDFLQQTNIQYKLDIAVNSTNFQQYQTLYGLNSVTIPNLRLDDNYYCFRLRAFDPCLGRDRLSPPICSHNFDLAISGDLNKLDWQTASIGVSSVDILRDKGLYTSIPGAPLTFPDRDVKCNVTYCYQVISNYVGGAKSISLEKCGKAFTTIKPSTIVNTSSVVSATGVQLNWIQDPAFATTGYTILRSQNQGGFLSLAASPTPQYQDGTYHSDSPFCYEINYADQCNNKSADSSPICPIRLQGSVSDKNEISLSWNEYLGWDLGVKNYTVEKYDQKGTLLKTTDVGSSNTYVEDPPDIQNQIVSYRIIAKSKQAGLTSSVSNQITLLKEVNLFYPTAFTPDRKGPLENETFTVRGQFIAKAELSIFDRWGFLIFYSDKNEPWDGTQSGQPMPIASYVWTANITDLVGRSLKRSGTVLLLRK